MIRRFWAALARLVAAMEGMAGDIESGRESVSAFYGLSEGDRPAAGELPAAKDADANGRPKARAKAS